MSELIDFMAVISAKNIDFFVPFVFVVCIFLSW